MPSPGLTNHVNIGHRHTRSSSLLGAHRHHPTKFHRNMDISNARSLLLTSTNALLSSSVGAAASPAIVRFYLHRSRHASVMLFKIKSCAKYQRSLQPHGNASEPNSVPTSIFELKPNKRNGKQHAILLVIPKWTRNDHSPPQRLSLLGSLLQGPHRLKVESTFTNFTRIHHCHDMPSIQSFTRLEPNESS